MRRIAILGNAAGGKSTLARHLAKTLEIPHVEVDALFWMPDWSQVAPETYNRDHDEAIAQDNWVMDGVGSLPSMQRRLERATEVILLDLPLWVHFWRAAERQMAWSNGTLKNPPGGGQSMPSTKDLFKIIADVDRDWVPKFRDLCDAQERLGKKVLRIDTLDDFEALLDPE